MTPSMGTRQAAAAGSRRSAAATRVAPTRRKLPLRAVRRVSGETRTRQGTRQRVSRGGAVAAPQIKLRPLPVLGTIGNQALRAGKSINGSSLLDRLVQGRGWIGLLGVLLIGLVFLNVSLLKLNAQAGRNAEAARELRIKNAELNGKVTRLASAERIQKQGEKLGLVMPSAGAINYLTPRGAYDGKLAAQRIDKGLFTAATAPVPVEVAPPEETVDPTADPSVTGIQPEEGTTYEDPADVTPETAAPVTDQTATGGGMVPPAATTPGTG